MALKYQLREKAIILLEDGTVFYGKAVGSVKGTAFGEICFNTGMTGYQEIFTDPSYYGQLLVTTNAHIGNYGTFKEDVESSKVQIAGLICKNFSYEYSRPLADMSLEEFLTSNKLIAVSDVDTRALVSYIRQKGAMNAAITTEVNRLEEIKAELKDVPDMQGLELSSKVSTKTPYFYGDENAKYKISAIDSGIKLNILRNLAARDCYIKVFPYDASFQDVSAWNPDGYFLSNGPGDPQEMKTTIETTKQIIAEDKPLFGICLGHQIIAMANGIPTYKMHQGHRGINHPVRNNSTGRGEITSQNHGFAVDAEALKNNPDIELTHLHLNDNSVAGLRMKNKKCCFSVQYHPEASAGPHDASYLFDQFVDSLKA